MIPPVSRTRPSVFRRAAAQPPGQLYKWTTLGATLSTLAIGAWHVATLGDPVAVAANECVAPVPVIALAWPAANASRALPTDDGALLDDSPIVNDEEPEYPFEGIDDGINGRGESETDRSALSNDDFSGFGTAGHGSSQRVFRFEDSDDDDLILVARSTLPGDAASASETGGGARLAPSCLQNALCIAASLVAGGPVPDHYAGAGYLFGQARQAFRNGNFQAAASLFHHAAAQVPQGMSKTSTAGRDRTWICRAAAVAMAATAVTTGGPTGPTGPTGLTGSAGSGGGIAGTAPPSTDPDPDLGAGCESELARFARVEAGPASPVATGVSAPSTDESGISSAPTHR